MSHWQQKGVFSTGKKTQGWKKTWNARTIPENNNENNKDTVELNYRCHKVKGWEQNKSDYYLLTTITVAELIWMSFNGVDCPLVLIMSTAIRSFFFQYFCVQKCDIGKNEIRGISVYQKEI